jgi:hypothetical protein
MIAWLQAMDEDKTEQMLYRLHPSLLKKHSNILHDMFTLPSLTAKEGGGEQRSAILDGCDDNHPVHLPHPNITIQKFDHLLTYMFCGPRSGLDFKTKNGPGTHRS